MQESISKMTKRNSLLKTGIFLLLLSLVGCGDMGWTNIQWENRNNETIRVYVKGIIPNPSGGVVPSGAGADDLSRVALNFDDPINIADTITIEWTTKDGKNKRSQELKRNDFNIPAKVSCGKLRFIYSAEGKWSIKYKK